MDEGTGEARDRGEDRGGAPGNLLTCSFCGRSQREIRRLVAGPGVYTCDDCVEVAAGVAGSGTAAATQPGAMHAVPEQDREVRCSFCGKERGQVAGMAAVTAEAGGQAFGPAAICTECLTLCHEILSED